MKESVSDDFLQRFTKQFEKDHPSVKLEVTFQDWTGIGKKVNAALEGENTPDVIEVGNTQVAQYAETDALTDLTLESVRDLGNEDWLPGLAEPGNINGSQYGIPWYAANRVVIYNKDLFAEAGITTLPKTYSEWLDITEELDKGANQGIYLPGQDWYTLAGFIWEEGGDLAAERNGDWVGTLDTPAAQRGMKFYKKLQALGDGPKDADERTPPQAGVFAKGNVAQTIAVPGTATAIEKSNPSLKGKLGYFPIPGKSANKPGAVLTGGSDLIIPEKAPQRGNAIEVVKALAGEQWQMELAKAMNYVPNKQTLAKSESIQNQGITAAMAQGAAAKGSQATPNSPKWGHVEAENPIKGYMTLVLKGGDIRRGAKTASERITAILSPG